MLNMDDFNKNKPKPIDMNDWFKATPLRKGVFDVDKVYVRISEKVPHPILTISIGLNVIKSLNLKAGDRVDIFFSKLNPFCAMLKRTVDGSGYCLSSNSKSTTCTVSLTFGIKALFHFAESKEVPFEIVQHGVTPCVTFNMEALKA